MFTTLPTLAIREETMWCFLCDRPAKWRIPLHVKDERGFLKAMAEEPLQARQDGYRRVQ